MVAKDGNASASLTRFLFKIHSIGTKENTQSNEADEDGKQEEIFTE